MSYTSDLKVAGCRFDSRSDDFGQVDFFVDDAAFDRITSSLVTNLLHCSDLHVSFSNKHQLSQMGCAMLFYSMYAEILSTTVLHKTTDKNRICEVRVTIRGIVP